jgi:hypothetical protein
MFPLPTIPKLTPFTGVCFVTTTRPTSGGVTFNVTLPDEFGLFYSATGAVGVARNVTTPDEFGLAYVVSGMIGVAANVTIPDEFGLVYTVTGGIS